MVLVHLQSIHECADLDKTGTDEKKSTRSLPLDFSTHTNEEEMGCFFLQHLFTMIGVRIEVVWFLHTSDRVGVQVLDLHEGWSLQSSDGCY
jgi:hypothetical protein